jgi:hypothetical protein
MLPASYTCGCKTSVRCSLHRRTGERKEFAKLYCDHLIHRRCAKKWAKKVEEEIFNGEESYIMSCGCLRPVQAPQTMLSVAKAVRLWAVDVVSKPSKGFLLEEPPSAGP